MSNNKREKSTAKSDHFNRSCHDATLINPGPPALYLLNTERDYIDGNEKKVRRWTYGKRDRNNQNKVILLVGETGAGKTTITNTMINYLLGVKFEDEEFYQITEEPEKHDDQTQSQTSVITVYEVFVEENPTSLTIIDTPGYGNTDIEKDAKGYEKDREISEYLIRLFSDEDGINHIDAACFVIKASQNRLTGREFYIFHSVLSLFGKDIKDNIVFLLTHSEGGPPTDALNAINKVEIPCRRDEDNEPVHFLFSNQQKKKRDKRYKNTYKLSWEMGDESMKEFFTLLEEKNRKSVKMSLDVLIERIRLEACVSNLKQRITKKELKTKELAEIQETIRQNRDKIMECETLEFTVNKVVTKKVPIENEWWWNRNPTCCSACEENCHEWRCWWVKDLSWCSVMKNNHCTVCTGKCHYSIHEKENKKYVTMTEQVKMKLDEIKKEYEHTEYQPETNSFDNKIFEDVKKQHESHMKEAEVITQMETRLKIELEKIKNEKSELVDEASNIIITLSEIALKADSAFTLRHLDFLILRLKEEGKFNSIKALEDLSKSGKEQKKKGFGELSCQSHNW